MQGGRLWQKLSGAGKMVTGTKFRNRDPRVVIQFVVRKFEPVTTFPNWAGPYRMFM